MRFSMPGARAHHHQVPADCHGRTIPEAGRRGLRAISKDRESTTRQRRPKRCFAMGARRLLWAAGNSAGQAAVFLAGHASRVLLLIRGDDLNKNMSSYLVQRIEQTPNIELLCNTTIRQMLGNGHLQAIEIVITQADRRGPSKLRRSSVSSERRRAPIGFLRKSSAIERICTDRVGGGAIETGASRGRLSCWKPVIPVYLPRATCARGL